MPMCEKPFAETMEDNRAALKAIKAFGQDRTDRIAKKKRRQLPVQPDEFYTDQESLAR